MSDQRIITSRASSFKRFSNHNEAEQLAKKENIFIHSNLNLWTKDFQAGFLPPPPRPPFLGDLETDGITSCDLCSWSASGDEKVVAQYSPVESTNHFILLLVFVSFFSAAVGGLIALRYRRSSSIRAFGIRNCPNKKQDVSTDQLCEDAPNRPSRQTGEMKKNAIDLKFFMEDNQDNEIYATLDDQVSLNSDTDNITTYHRKNGFYNKSDYSHNEIPSAPSSSAYYSGSDFSGVVSATERQYESIDNVNQQQFGGFYDKNQDSRSFGGNTFITFSNNVISNRLSAITELQSTQMIRSDVNSDIVNSQYV